MELCGIREKFGMVIELKQYITHPPSFLHFFVTQRTAEGLQRATEFLLVLLKLKLYLQIKSVKKRGDG